MVKDKQEDDDDKVTLICGAATLGSFAVRGSVIRRCSECRQMVFVAPAGQKAIAEGAIVMCTDCVSPSPDDPINLAPGVMDDLRSAGFNLTEEQWTEIARNALKQARAKRN